MITKPLKIGVGGPVGSGKTALVEALCTRFWPSNSLAVITNDIYTREDADFLVRAGSLPAERKPLFLFHRTRRLSPSLLWHMTDRGSTATFQCFARRQ